MIRLASDFRKVAKIAQITCGAENKTLQHIHSVRYWKEHQHVIQRTLSQIRDKADQGCYRVYLPEDDVLWRTQEVHDFFIKSGFSFDCHSIHWWDTSLEKNEMK